MPFPYNGEKYDPNERGRFKVPPVGNYRVMITEAEEKRSTSSGNMMMAITCQIVDGDYAGQKLWYYIPYDDSAINRFGSLFDALGMDSGAETQIEPEVLLNREGMVKVKHELYKDEERAKIHYWVADPEAPAAAPKQQASGDGEHEYTAADEPPEETELEEIPF